MKKYRVTALINDDQNRLQFETDLIKALANISGWLVRLEIEETDPAKRSVPINRKQDGTAPALDKL